MTTKIALGPFQPASQEALHAHLLSTTTTHLSGHRLTVARLATMGLVALTLLAFLPLLPVYIGYLSVVCVRAACPVGQLTPLAVQALRAAGLSVNAFVAYTLILTLLALLMCWSVAAVIVWRKSDDWMALLVAVMLVLMGTSYVTHLLLQQPSPWQVAALLLDILTFGVFFLVFCLFPSGRFVPSWLGFLPVAWIVWGAVAISLHAVPRFYSLYLAGFLCALIVIVSAQVYRYRRISTLGERQQTKWVVWGASISMMSVVSISLPEVLMPSLVEQNWLYRLLDAPALTLALFLGAFSIGMAILRSHLWNIDVLINRTLVYSTLTGCLTCVYVSLVIALQFLLRGLFSHTHDVALVASTLAIAALFHPLRRRIQHGIDRRFYRSKYDGAQTLADFSDRLRSCDDVDLATLTNDLLRVVQETMQPANVSLWLRPHTWEVKHSTRLLPRIDGTPTETDPESVLPLKMVDKSNSPLQTRFGPVFGDVAVQTGLLSPE